MILYGNSKEAIQKITEHLEQKKLGKKEIHYKLKLASFTGALLGQIKLCNQTPCDFPIGVTLMFLNRLGPIQFFHAPLKETWA